MSSVASLRGGNSHLSGMSNNNDFSQRTSSIDVILLDENDRLESLSGSMRFGNEDLLSRLELPKRYIAEGEQTFLPSGQCLPKHFNLSLIQKIPMFPSPQGAIEPCLGKLSQPVYVSTQHLDFDLSDPNMYMVSTKYRSLTDPNLWHYHRQPIVRKLIERNQQLTSDSRVRCRLAELNHYRAYLKHLGLKQFEKQREEEKQKVANLRNMDPGDNLEIAIIQTQIHEEDVRQRHIDLNEEKENEARENIIEIERHVAEVTTRKECMNQPGMKQLADQEQHRGLVHTRANQIDRQRKRIKLRNYKKKMKRHLEVMKAIGENVARTKPQKILAGYERIRDYQWQYESRLRASYDKESDRSLRYQKMFLAEMYKRWLEQAGKLDKRRREAREKQLEIEGIYSANLAKAFVKSQLINSDNSPKLANQKIIHPEEVVMRPPEPESNMTDVSVYMDAIDAVKVPFLRTVPTKEGVTHDLAIKQPLDELGVNVRLHHPDGTIPDTLNTDR